MSKVDAHKKIFFPALSAVIILTLIIGVYLSYRKKKDNNVIVLFLLCILFGFLPMCMGPLNGHYLMMIQPILLLGVAFILQSQQFAEITDKFFPAFLIILVLMLAVSFQFKRNFFNTRNITFAPKAISIASCIPEDEKSETYCYLVPGVFYVITDIKPISKYFIFQEFHGSADNHILKEINQQVEKNKPKWLIVGTSNPDDLQNKEFVNILKSNYSLYKEEVGDQEALVLYRLNEAE